MATFVSVYHKRLLAFEYLLNNLLKWHDEVRPSRPNDLSTLKSIKLLFFVSSVNAKKGGNNYLLTNVFKDFVAMPYGHVESGIYEEIKNRGGVLNYYVINNRTTIPNIGADFSSLINAVELETRKEIDSAVKALKILNRDLIALSAFELVDLSHSFYSWKKNIAEAKVVGSNSVKIPLEDIIQEDKTYTLQIF